MAVNGAANGYMTLVPPSQGAPATVPALVNKDANGVLTVPSELWTQNASGLYVPVGYGSGGTSLPVSLTGSNATQDGVTPGQGDVLRFDAVFDETSWNRMRGVTATTLLASAARTSTTATPVQSNINGRGVILFLNVTAASGTGGLTLHLQIKDPASGNLKDALTASSAVVATGTYVYELYPGLGTASGGVTQAANGILSRNWQVTVTHGDSSSYTYSLAACVIP